MNHYDVLGVERDATADEIRAAWRRKCSEHHPDHGGDHNAIAAVNKAYEVLGDAARRKRFDDTGSDEPGKDVDEEARSMVLSIFAEAIDADPSRMLVVAHSLLGTKRQQALRALQVMQARREGLMTLSGKWRVKEGRNLAQQIVDQRIENIGREIDAVQEAIVAFGRAAALLRDYEDTQVYSLSFFPA